MTTIAPAPNATTLLTMRVPITMKERFDWMAKVMDRPRNYVLVEALQRYLDEEEWQLKDILEALHDSSGEEDIPHEDVMRDARELIERARGAQTDRVEP